MFGESMSKKLAERLQSSMEEQVVDMMLGARSLNGGRGPQRGNQPAVKCFNCNGEGHIARNCPQPQRRNNTTAAWPYCQPAPPCAPPTYGMPCSNGMQGMDCRQDGSWQWCPNQQMPPPPPPSAQGQQGQAWQTQQAAQQSAPPVTPSMPAGFVPFTPGQSNTSMQQPQPATGAVSMQPPPPPPNSLTPADCQSSAPPPGHGTIIVSPTSNQPRLGTPHVRQNGDQLIWLWGYPETATRFHH